MRSSGLDRAPTSTRSLLPTQSSLLDVDFALWDVASHLNIASLYQLCAAAKEVMPRGSPGVDNELWRLVANRTQGAFFFSGLDVATIKKLIYMMKDIPVVDSETFQVNSPQMARAIIQTISQAKAKNLSHLREGGLCSETFFTRFCFPPDQLQGWLSNPMQAITSYANTFPVGKAFLLISLTVRNGELSVFVSRDDDDEDADDDEGAFVPILISIRGLSSSVIVRKEVALVAEGHCVRAASLFSPGSPRAAAAAFKEGLQCVVCVRDFVEGFAPEPSWRTVSSLNLDRLRCEVVPL